MAAPAALRALVYGQVQGVFFRAYVSRRAAALGITGYVRNLPEGTVEVEAEATRDRLARLISDLKIGPPGARVDKVKITWFKPVSTHANFEIR